MGDRKIKIVELVVVVDVVIIGGGIVGIVLVKVFVEKVFFVNSFGLFVILIDVVDLE